MRCPHCHASETKVLDSRSANDGFVIRRRRECPRCRSRFSTYEEVELLNFYVIKKDGRRELYDRTKLERGIRRACEKRPIAEETILKMLSRIEQKIREDRKREIGSRLIGELVMKELKKLDDVAYIRFASVYKSFKDVESFAQELSAFTDLKRQICRPQKAP
ncbi:MAG: transcriptional regulator NrdR [Patescibacteria group bacterium]|nr:transcriptional regulator NrdR [Patescibacteria group bacterium]